MFWKRELWPRVRAAFVPNTEKGLARRPVDRRFWGVAKGCQQCHAKGPEFLSSAWVSQLPTLLAGQRGVWRALAPRNSLLPVSFPWTSTCSEEGAERTERGLARATRTDLPSVGKYGGGDSVQTTGTENLGRGHLLQSRGPARHPFLPHQLG